MEAQTSQESADCEQIPSGLRDDRRENDIETQLTAPPIEYRSKPARIKRVAARDVIFGIAHVGVASFLGLLACIVGGELIQDIRASNIALGRSVGTLCIVILLGLASYVFAVFAWGHFSTRS